VWHWLNSFGLVLGMVGVVLIFFWPPPTPPFITQGYIALEGEDQSAVARIKSHKRISAIGLILIFLGFLAQFIASLPIS
jgi:quinol-cytochrome oxidoreductase complex cytochrome b subunit